MQIEIWDVALELGISADLEVAKHEPGGKFFKLGKPRFWIDELTYSKL